MPASAFTDIVPLTFGGITLNNNEQYASGVPGLPTTASWDLTTAFGSPKALGFVQALAAVP